MTAGPTLIVDLVDRVRREGADAVAADLGPFALVGSLRAPDEDAWSFSTQAVASPADVAAEGGFDLSHGVVHPLKKRGRTFADTLLIGRSSSNDVKIDDTTVSKLHARARLDADGFWLEDAGSRNGTFVEGERLGPSEIAVYPGDTVRFGSCTFKVHRSDRLCDLLRRIRA